MFDFSSVESPRWQRRSASMANGERNRLSLSRYRKAKAARKQQRLSRRANRS